MGWGRRPNRKRNYDVAIDPAELAEQKRAKKEENFGTSRTIEKTNEYFEKYYRQLGIVSSDEEWEEFMSALRRPLPISFRITGTKLEAKDVAHLLKNKFFSKLNNVVDEDGNVIEPPKELPWYPDGLAFAYTMGRREMRRDTQVTQFWRYLVQETELGNISRQEAVSMIPPLFMDVKPNHRVLDMCAAPGSKTSQLIEALHEGYEHGREMPEGFVMANDTDIKRCHLLVHQIQRLRSPCVIVTNYDAANFPALDLGGERLLFDRVLCDVPCSGDGTLRKNLTVWKDWKPAGGLGLNKTQLRILIRGCQLLKTGGQLVYSTCSLNPAEDEAVIAHMMLRYPGCMELVDVSAQCPDLKRMPGMYNWNVITRDGTIYERHNQLPAEQRRISKTVFSPGEDFCKSIHMERSMRLLPHLQDTGGFFVAVLRKLKPLGKADIMPTQNPSTGLPAEPTVVEEDNIDSNNDEDDDDQSGDEAEPVCVPEDKPSASSEAKKDKDEEDEGFAEDPIVFADPSYEPIVKIRNFFGLNDFPFHNLIARSNKFKRLYLLGPHLAEVVRAIQASPSNQRLRVVNIGVRVFLQNEAYNEDCAYRLQQDSVSVVQPFLKSQLSQVGYDDVVKLLKTDVLKLTDLSDPLREKISALSRGSCLLVYTPKPEDSVSQIPIIFVAWRGKSTLAMQVHKRTRNSFLFRLGEDVEFK